jgi:hypothetical protein
MFGLLVAISAGLAMLNPPTLSEYGKQLASTVDCSQFKKTPDGSWISGPNAKIGFMDVPNNKFGKGGFVMGDTDISDVLEAKCGATY